MDKWQTVFRNEASEYTGRPIRNVYVDEPESGEVVCRVFGHPDVKVQEDRACLIASAPTLKQQRDDLLGALKIVLRTKVLILPKGLVKAEFRDEVTALQKMYDKVDATIAKCET